MHGSDVHPPGNVRPEAMFASADPRPGQTRRESGTQSQGSSDRKTARLPVAIVGMHNQLRWCREGEPGALHNGRVASGDHGRYSRSGSQVALTGTSPLDPTTDPHDAAL